LQRNPPQFPEPRRRARPAPALRLARFGRPGRACPHRRQLVVFGGSAPGKCASRSPFLPVTAGRRGPTWTPGHMDSWPAREEAAMITVHHLNNSRSQRILWLLEELGLDYEVVRYQRDAETMAAPAELR